MEADEYRAYKEVAREMAVEEIVDAAAPFNAAELVLGEITQAAIDQYDRWRSRYDFGWERVIGWKTKPAHIQAMDIAVWHNNTLAGLCWASPRDSKEKVFVLYLERNPDDQLVTKGYVAPLCLTAVRSYASLLEMKFVVISDPIPEVRKTYLAQGFKQIPGIGLAYNLLQDYDPAEEEVFHDEI